MMIEWTESHILRLGGSAEIIPNPAATKLRPLPPILAGQFGTDPTKKMVCVYGHLVCSIFDFV